MIWLGFLPARRYALSVKKGKKRFRLTQHRHRIRHRIGTYVGLKLCFGSERAKNTFATFRAPLHDSADFICRAAEK